MRTKTLLLTAALSAAGVATSMAQVFSVNAVGYVNVTLAPKFNLVANPLRASNNTIAELFKNIEGGVPNGLQVYKFNGAAGFKTATFDDLDNAFGPADAAAQTVLPGEGVFVNNPTTGNLKLTFVGEVEQGNLVNQLPVGLSIKSSMVPQDGPLFADPSAGGLGFKGVAGDQVFQFNTATQSYTTSTFDDLDNKFDKDITLKAGEAFFLRKETAGTWTRQFTVQ